MSQSARALHVLRTEARLRRQQQPHLHLALILAGAGTAAFLTTAGLLRLGLTHMAARYLVAVLVGYGTFLMLVRTWVYWQLGGRPQLPEDMGVDALTEAPPHEASPQYAGFGGGGEFSGGGSSGVIPDMAGDLRVADAPIVPQSPPSDLRDLSDAADSEEGIALLPVALVGLGAAFAITAVFGLVATAPTLLAEVFVDAALTAGIYRRLRGTAVQHWTAGVFQRTWRPVLGIAAVVVTVAILAQGVRPSADSIGDFFRRS